MISATHIACHYLRSCGWPVSEIATRIGLPEETVREWIATPLPKV